MGIHTKAETKVLSVKLNVVDRAAMIRRLDALGISTKGEDKDLVASLIKHFKAQMVKGALSPELVGQCDVCGGYSDLQLDECPYCGTKDKASVVGDEGDSNVDPIEASEYDADEDSDGVANGDKGANNPQLEPFDDAVPKNSIEQQSKNAVYSVADLDSEIVNLRNAAVATARGLFAYGKILEKIRSMELWKLRGKYKSFDQFCKTEVNVSRAQAYKILAVVANYSEAQLEKYGLWKLNMALDVPEELRAKLLGDGSETRGELTERAKALIGKESEARKTPSVDRSKAVSVAIVPGIVEVTMQKRPTADDWPTGKLTEPAKSLSEDPWFRLGLTNNVFLSVRLTRNDKGEIVAIVEHRRGESQA